MGRCETNYLVARRSGEFLAHHPPLTPQGEFKAALLTYYNKKGRRQGARRFLLGR